MEDSRGWRNYENMFILYISDSLMNSAVTIAGLMNIALPLVCFHDQLLVGRYDLTFNLKTCDRSSGSSSLLSDEARLCLGVRSVVFATIVQHHSNFPEPSGTEPEKCRNYAFQLSLIHLIRWIVVFGN